LEPWRGLLEAGSERVGTVGNDGAPRRSAIEGALHRETRLGIDHCQQAGQRARRRRLETDNAVLGGLDRGVLIGGRCAALASFDPRFGRAAKSSVGGYRSRSARLPCGASPSGWQSCRRSSNKAAARQYNGKRPIVSEVIDPARPRISQSDQGSSNSSTLAQTTRSQVLLSNKSVAAAAAHASGMSDSRHSDSPRKSNVRAILLASVLVE
jgi:hypothetical protein